jgi:hypothetical protein
MASLTKNVAVFAAFDDYKPMPMRANAAATYYRGGLVFFIAGRIQPLVTDTVSEFAGIVAESTIITAQDQPVLIYPASAGGLFLFANTNFTIANQNLLFYQTLAGEDDPSTLTTTAAGNSSAVGRLVQVRTTAVDGWISIGDRFNPAETA